MLKLFTFMCVIILANSLNTNNICEICVNYIKQTSSFDIPNRIF
uniref:Uncharacterized protein n=1 Tax=viral metagenome TaxID=1070528 RepID=A0A6C0JAV9_9ZZZZ